MSRHRLAQSLRISDILISLSHCRAYATAYAIAVGSASESSDYEI